MHRTDEISLRLKLRWDLAAMEVMLRALRLRMLLHKANFNPNQPRVPPGNPDGGQWTDDSRPTDSDSTGDDLLPLLRVSHDSGGPDHLPEIPGKKPSTTREKNTIARAVARFLKLANPRRRVAEIALWVIEHAGDRIIAFLDEPKTLEELQRAVGEPKFGYDIHHIVEQGPARRGGFPESMISAPENLVRIPTYRHWEISGWYQIKTMPLASYRLGNIFATRIGPSGRAWGCSR